MFYKVLKVCSFVESRVESCTCKNVCIKHFTQMKPSRTDMFRKIDRNASSICSTIKKANFVRLNFESFKGA